jgi:hypothetical protein
VRWQSPAKTAGCSVESPTADSGELSESLFEKKIWGFPRGSVGLGVLVANSTKNPDQYKFFSDILVRCVRILRPPDSTVAGSPRTLLLIALNEI